MTTETIEAPAADTTSDVTESTPVTSEEATNGNTPVEPQDTTEDVSDDFLESFNLEALLNADFSGDEIMSTTHKGLPEYNEILKHLPENGRKLISNLRSMTTKKTQEVADIKRDLEQKLVALEHERKALYSGQFAKNVDTLAAEPETPHDLFSDTGMEGKIKQEAAKLFQQMLKPMQEEMYVNTRTAALETFKRDNPDLMDPEIKIEVARLLRDRSELKLEDAYFITKAKLDRSKLQELETENRLQRDKNKQAWEKTSNGSNVGKTSSPQFRDAWESYQYHKANGIK
jgi:hypothetical protein